MLMRSFGLILQYGKKLKILFVVTLSLRRVYCILELPENTSVEGGILLLKKLMWFALDSSLTSSLVEIIFGLSSIRCTNSNHYCVKVFQQF